jgi:copper oxidase (laccase) domain-containing protein
MVRILSQLFFQSGQASGQEDSIILPLLTKLNITHAISIGPQSTNMAESFNHSHDDLEKRQDKFLSKNKLEPLNKAYFSIVPSREDMTIGDITTPNNTSQGIAFPADAVFTQLLSTPLIHKPADCPTAIIFAKKDALSILGLAHLGRPQVNKRVTEQTVDHLTDFYHVNPKDIFVGISPSIGPKHYFIKKKDQEVHHFIDLDYWGESAWNDSYNDEAIIRIDVLKKILSVLKQKGIPDENIEAYGHNDVVDTYHLASLTPPLALSHRFATETHQPGRNGRIMVAAQL